MEAAAGELAAAGRPASEAVRERIAGSLHAAAREPRAAALAREGRLARDLDPPGFGGGAWPVGVAEAEAAGPAGRRGVEAGRVEDAEGNERLLAGRRARDEARRQARAAADAAILARRQAEQLRHAADRAEQAAIRAREAADDAVQAERRTRERAARTAAELADAEARLVG